MKNKDKVEKELEKLKLEYQNIEIPSKLDSVVNKSLKNSKNKNYTKWCSLAATLFLVIGVNISPVFAEKLEKIPLIGGVIKVINIKNYTINENGFEASIDVPKIEGLVDKEVEYKLNKGFEEEGKRLYNECLEEVKNLKEGNIEGRELYKSWYEVYTDNETILSIVIYNYQAQGSSNTTRKFYNINKKNKEILSLQGMFEGTDYINIISENIISQMKERMKNDTNDYYWVDEEQKSMNFKKIKKDQGFYINDNNELVICFDKYEVGPGSTGITEFIIPKDVIQPILSN